MRPIRRRWVLSPDDDEAIADRNAKNCGLGNGNRQLGSKPEHYRIRGNEQSATADASGSREARDDEAEY